MAISMTERDERRQAPEVDSNITVDVYSDSILKYLRSGEEVTVNLTAVRGGRIQDVTKLIEKKMNVDVAVIHVGTNNLTDDYTTMEGFKKDYTRMMKMMDYTYSCPIIISGILPRLDRPDLEPMRITVNHLLGSLVASRVVNSNGKFSFLSWDDCFTNYSLFSLDGLHPSREGNLHLHRELKSHLRWFTSEERHHAHNRVVEMVRAELHRTRQEARDRDRLKKAAKANRVSTCENYDRPHLVRRRRSSRRHY